LADDLNLVAAQSVLIHAQAVFHQIGHVDHFLHPPDLRIILLHGHNFLDVLDVPTQRIQFADDGRLGGQEMFGELGQMSRQMFAPRVIGNKLPQVMRLFLEQQYDSGETGGPELLHALNDQSGGDVDAVEHVADVMEHVGGNFRHAAPAGSFQQLLVNVLQFGLRSFALGDVGEYNHGAAGTSVLAANRRADILDGK